MVKVEAADVASITNRRIGDLMDEDLRNYVLASLRLNSADLVSAYRNPVSEDEEIYHYENGDIDIDFSTRPAFTQSGLEGILLKIRISKQRQ